jgi:hypothetical protein
LKAKILALDIETKPAIAYIWNTQTDFISIDKIIDPGGVLCVGAKWVGERGVTFLSEWEHGSKDMLQGILDLLEEADAVISYNGKRFDLPKLRGEFILHGLQPPPPVTHIDVWQTTKSLGYISSKLAFIGPYLKIGKKVDHEGFDLWKKVLAGDEAARARMQKYCMKDVTLLEQVYNRLKPFITNHPNLSKQEGNSHCHSCGSKKLQKRGYRYTKLLRIQRHKCNSCGSWQDGKREKLG